MHVNLINFLLVFISKGNDFGQKQQFLIRTFKLIWGLKREINHLVNLNSRDLFYAYFKILISLPLYGVFFKLHFSFMASERSRWASWLYAWWFSRVISTWFQCWRPHKSVQGFRLVSWQSGAITLDNQHRGHLHNKTVLWQYLRNAHLFYLMFIFYTSAFNYLLSSIKNISFIYQ